MIVGRALRPIERMRREVAEVATTQRAHRIPEPATNHEVGRLARTLNSMLDRIEASSRDGSGASSRTRPRRASVPPCQHPYRDRGRPPPPEPGRLAGRGPGRAGPERAHGPARRGASVAGPFARRRADAGGRAGRPGRGGRGHRCPWSGRFPEIVVTRSRPLSRCPPSTSSAWSPIWWATPAGSPVARSR